MALSDADGLRTQAEERIAAKLATDIAIWLRVHVSREWEADSEAVIQLAQRLVRVTFDD